MHIFATTNFFVTKKHKSILAYLGFSLSLCNWYFGFFTGMAYLVSLAFGKVCLFHEMEHLAIVMVYLVLSKQSLLHPLWKKECWLDEKSIPTLLVALLTNMSSVHCQRVIFTNSNTKEQSSAFLSYLHNSIKIYGMDWLYCRLLKMIYCNKRRGKHSPRFDPKMKIETIHAKKSSVFIAPYWRLCTNSTIFWLHVYQSIC